MINLVDNVKEVSTTLSLANEWNLQAEVIAWALTEIKLNPKLEIGEVLKSSVQEWLK